MAEGGEPSAAHAAALNSFLEVTQEANGAAAVQLLESAGWNVESALALYFEVGLDARAPPAPARANATQAIGNGAGVGHGAEAPRISLLEELNRELVAETAPRVQPEPEAYTTSGSSVFSTMFKPFVLVGRLLSPLAYLSSLLLHTLAYVFPALPRLLGLGPGLGARALHGPYDPKRAALQYKRQFEEHFGANEIPFLENNYSNGLSEAQRDLKYFLVVITSLHHEDTAAFAKVLTAPTVVAMLKREDVIVWGGSATESEGWKLANGLHATAFPFVALIAPSPKTPQSSTVIMELLGRYDGGFDRPAALVNTIEERMETHSPKIMALRIERERANADRNIREQQDSAYERSLAADRARASERERQQSEAAEAARREAVAVAAAASYQEQLAQWKAWRSAAFAARGELAGPTAARVQIRFSSGERAVAKFAGDDSVATVYEYALCHGTPVPAEPVVKPAEFEPRFDFELVSLMPRKVLVYSTENTIKGSVQLWPSGSLVVETKDDDEDDD